MVIIDYPPPPPSSKNNGDFIFFIAFFFDFWGVACVQQQDSLRVTNTRESGFTLLWRNDVCLKQMCTVRTKFKLRRRYVLVYRLRAPQDQYSKHVFEWCCGISFDTV